MRTIKRITDKLITFSVIAALVAALMCGALSFLFSGRVSADDEKTDTVEFAPATLELTNTQFTETSGSYPASPTGWTASGTGSVKAGVIDLTASNYVNPDSNSTDGPNKAFELSQYPEYGNDTLIPRTPFGTDAFADTDAKTLLVNTMPGDNVTATYAYSSSDMTFEADSFYRVSVWVKTGNFAADTGATVKLTGLGENCAFYNINTVKDLNTDNGIPLLTAQNNYGWVKYTFYVRTAPSESATVKLSLGIGDAVTNGDEDPTDLMPSPAHGYAFFDTVTAERISAYDYAFETSPFAPSAVRDNVRLNTTGTSMALDLYNLDYLTANNGTDTVEIGTFSDNFELWTNAEYTDDDDEPIYSGQASAHIYNSYATVDIKDNDFGLTSNPWAPLGVAEDSQRTSNSGFGGTNGNILMINSVYTNGEFKQGARGVASPDVTIKQHRYYRFGVWVKADGKDGAISGGNGVSIAVKGQANDTANNNKLDSRYNNLTGDDEDKAHYGWKEQVIYIVGSSLSDLSVHFELWLGTPDSQSAGIAMFDNVTFTELSYSDYEAMSAADGGNVLTLDAGAADTGVTNGNFILIGDYDEFKYPLPAADWSYHTPSDVGTAGFSRDEVNTDNAVYGIVPANREAFDKLADRGEIPANIVNPAHFANAPLYNVLVLSSSTKTAFCYQTSAITIPADQATKIDVTMAVDRVTDGYGASLVLKSSDGAVVSTIENITSTNNNFKTFTFYIEAPLSEQSLTLEIWLGLNGRKNNTQKLSDGTVYVKEAACSEWTVDSDTSTTAEYAKKLDEFRKAAASPALLETLDFGVVSFSAPSLDFYDIYSYGKEGGFVTPYMWNKTTTNESTISGIFNSENLGNIYDGFDKKDQTDSMLFIYNTEFAKTTYSYANTISLVANTYYRLDVTLKVHLTDEIRNDKAYEGANVSLTGTATETFENIKDTTTLVAQGDEASRDYETFKTFSFYISSGADGGDIGLSISFGGDGAKGIRGILVVSDISLTSIPNTSYDEIAESDSIDTDYVRAVALSEASDDSSDDNNTEATSNDIQWWIIPTVIFSVCLVAAIIIIVVMRIRDRIKKKKKTVYTSEYDRTRAFKDIEKLANADGGAKTDRDEELDDEISGDGDDADDEHQTQTVTEAPATNEQLSESEEQPTSAQSKKADTDLND